MGGCWVDSIKDNISVVVGIILVYSFNSVVMEFDYMKCESVCISVVVKLFILVVVSMVDGLFKFCLLVLNFRMFGCYDLGIKIGLVWLFVVLGCIIFGMYKIMFVIYIWEIF